MDWLSTDFFTAFAAIVVINLMLSGDNAIVIALAARKLPPELRKRAVLGGTLGAILLRVLATLMVVWLLALPGLRLAGGVMLIWIAYQLLAPEEHSDQQVGRAARSKKTSVWAAVRTIVMADAIMSLDNMLGVAGAARGNMVLVALGLIISIPIMILGSSVILRLVDRYPLVVYVGAAVLAWTAAEMMIIEILFKDFIEKRAWLPWTIQGSVIGGVLLAGFLRQRRDAGA
jgi:YjbE family integral membrane protein